MRVVLAISNVVASIPHVEGLKLALPGHEIVTVDPKNNNMVITALETASVLIAITFKEEWLINAKNLKLIQVPFRGTDNIDFNLAKKYNIPVCNVSQQVDLIAEFCLAFLLAHVKQIVQSDVSFRQGKWESRHYKKLTLRKKKIF